jgi:hypothetical protein
MNIYPSKIIVSTNTYKNDKESCRPVHKCHCKKCRPYCPGCKISLQKDDLCKQKNDSSCSVNKNFTLPYNCYCCCGNINAHNNKIINLKSGCDPHDAVNLLQVKKIVKHSKSSINHNINMNNHKILDLADGTKPKDAVNLSQVKKIVSNSINNIDHDINMNNHKIINLATATNPKDAVNLEQVESMIFNIEPDLQTVLEKGNSAGSNNINMNNNDITNGRNLEAVLIKNNTFNNGLSFFQGYGTASLKSIYPFSGYIDYVGTKELLGLTLENNCSYTIIMVSGYYSPTNNKCGHFTKFINLCVSNNSINKKLLFWIDDSDIDDINIDVIATTGTDISAIILSSQNYQLNTTGTIELWRHS